MPLSSIRQPISGSSPSFSTASSAWWIGSAYFAAWATTVTSSPSITSSPWLPEIATLSIGTMPRAWAAGRPVTQATSA